MVGSHYLSFHILLPFFIISLSTRYMILYKMKINWQSTILGHNPNATWMIRRELLKQEYFLALYNMKMCLQACSYLCLHHPAFLPTSKTEVLHRNCVCQYILMWRRLKDNGCHGQHIQPEKSIRETNRKEDQEHQRNSAIHSAVLKPLKVCLCMTACHDHNTSR